VDKNIIKVSYDSDPIIFTIISAFRNLLRRSVFFDINREERDKNMYCPDYNLTRDSNTYNNNNNKDNNILSDTKLIKKNIDSQEGYEKINSYTLEGQKVIIRYRYNNIGYRGENVSGTEKFIAIGCSQTYGSSLEEEFTWPAQLEKILGSRVVNLGMPGDSARGSILKAMAYIKQFGKPEAIFACFPISRSERFAVPGKTVNKKQNLPGPFNAIYVKDGFKLISKAPYDYEEVTPYEDYILDTFSFINMFDAYCKEAGIKFIWTGWETMFASNRIKQVLNEYTSGFFFDNTMNDFNFIKDNPECHTEYINHPLFNYAADITIDSNGVKHGHKGIHWNIHMAEKCHSEYLKSIAIDNL
jgi:hypothetical protein